MIRYGRWTISPDAWLGHFRHHPPAFRHFGQRQGMVNEFVAERPGALRIVPRNEGNDFAQIILRLRREDYFDSPCVHQFPRVLGGNALAPASLPARLLDARQQFNLPRNLRQRSVFRQLIDEINDQFSTAHAQKLASSCWFASGIPAGGFTAAISRGVADGRGSSAPRPRRWCLQTEISASAIRRGRRKRPRWLCLGDGRKLSRCLQNL